MEYVIKDREPKLALKYFEDISAIPRGSSNEEAVARFIDNRAAELGLYHRIDHKWNVFVKKPATKGYEDKPPVLMQAHLDMVNEKNADTVHDFEKDGLKLRVDGDILTAEGTTLGADDGKGVAYMLALMDSDSDSFVHPPLEFLFTSEEEIGFGGAFEFDLSDVEAKRMIGLDAGPEGAVAITSSGSEQITFTIPMEKEPVTGDVIKITVSGLKGGHSAQCITKEYANSNKLMGRILHNVQKVADVRVCSMIGGMMFNAIPRENTSVIAITDGKKAAALEKIAAVTADIKAEYEASDPDIKITVADDSAAEMNSAAVSKTLIDVLYCVPNGVRMMNVRIDGLPVTSTNMGVVKTFEDRFTVNTMLRSHIRSCSSDYVDHMISVAVLAGVKPENIVVGRWLPAWPYMPESEMRMKADQLYFEKTGEHMKEVAVHGGLELGIFSEGIEGLEIVTLGCNGGDAHTVTEWMDLASYGRVYDFMKEFISRLAEE